MRVQNLNDRRHLKQHAFRAKDYENNVVYISRDVHYCLEKGLRFVGLADCPVRIIEVDRHRRMRTDLLEERMKDDVGQV